MELSLNQKQSQKMLFTPQMLESMQILKMGIMDLKNLIEEEMQSNPLLEETHRHDPPINLRQRTDKNIISRAPMLTKAISLHEDLTKQLSLIASSEKHIYIGKEIIGNINDDGYLKATSEEIALSLSRNLLEVEAIIAIIQNFEPIGVCARDLRECLLIQLKAKGKENTLEWKIVENLLDACGKKHCARIAKITDTSIDEVKKAITEISRLEPRPGRKYSNGDDNHYIIPDIYVKKVDEEYMIIPNKFDIPNIRINAFYNNLLNNNGSDKKTIAYIKEKLRAANFLIKCIDQRRETIQKITEFIIKDQIDCLEKGRSFIKPLTFKTVADAIERHESTISRAIANKYIAMPSGIYGLREFFNSKVSNDEPGQNGNHSSLSVKAKLKHLIDTENKLKPMTDQKIQKIFSEKGIKLSRRTIAKYREELKILPSYLRKK